MEMQTVYRCCPGWMQRGEERGCLHSEYNNTVCVCVMDRVSEQCVFSTGVCSSGTCFNGGKCSETSDQLCQCPEGFEGTRCQYGESFVPFEGVEVSAPEYSVAYLSFQCSRMGSVVIFH